MKHLRKSILTLLALTLFGGAGAWAQGQLLTTINASSGFTNGTQTFDNIVTVTLDDASYDANVGWFSSGSPRPVEVAPVNGVTVTGYMLYFSETGPMEFEGSSFTVALEGDRVLADDITTQLGSVGITKIEVYGTAPAQAIKLTPDATGKVWTLAETPDYDLDLNVVYYQKYALKDIPANWQVKVDGVDKTAAIDGDSLKISETAQVLLTPDHPERVKKVILVDVAGPQTLIVAKGSTALSGNKELYYITGDTYRQALARPENQSGNDLGWGFWESSDLTTIYFKEVSNTAWDMAIDSDHNFAPSMGTCAITLDSVIDPNHAFQFTDSQ